MLCRVPFLSSHLQVSKRLSQTQYFIFDICRLGFLEVMTPIEDYVLQMLQYYLFWILNWTFENMTVLVYYLVSLTYIVLVEYIFLFFTGKKKTEINFCVFVLNCEKIFSIF